MTFDNLERGHRWAVKWGPFEQGNLRDEDELEHVFEAWHPEAVIHFALYAYVGESNVEPLKYYSTTVGGTANMLKACVKFECKNVVFSSSCATYGVPSRLPLTEIDPQRPINPYGYTKLAVERMLRDVQTAHGVRHVALRYFNAAGADPGGELGELPEPETHLIPLVLFTAMGKQNAVKIFGTDYLMDDGTCIRDYVHVSDLADAHEAAAEWLAAGKPSEAFNLGNGRGYSVAEVVTESGRITERKIKTEICAKRKLLGWEPHFPSIDDQIRHTWSWFCKLHSS